MVSYHDEHLMENTGGAAGHSLEEGNEQVHHQYVLDKQVDGLQQRRQPHARRTQLLSVFLA